MVYRADQPIHVWVKILTARNDDRMSIRDILHALGKFAGVGHLSAVYQYRNDRRFPLQNGLYLDANPVIFTKDAATALLGTEPLWPDHGYYEIGFVERLVETIAKIDAARDIVDIDKNRFFAIVANQPIKDAASDRLR